MFGMTTQTQTINSNKVKTLDFLTMDDFLEFADEINYNRPAVVKEEESSK